MYGLLAKVSADDDVLLTTNFQENSWRNRIPAIIPVTVPGSGVEGFAFTGGSPYSSPSAALWVWLVKLDLNLAEAHVGTVSHERPDALAQEGAGFMVGGHDR